MTGFYDPATENEKTDANRGFYGQNVRDLNVVNVVQEAQKAATRSENAADKSEDYRDEARDAATEAKQYRDETEQFRDEVAGSYQEIVDEGDYQVARITTLGDQYVIDTGNNAAAAAQSAADALTQAERAEDEADRAASIASNLDAALRDAGRFDPTFGSLPVPPDQELAWVWFSTNNGQIGNVIWTEGDQLVYVPHVTDPAGTFGNYYRVAGELAEGGTPQPVELLDDLIIQEGKSILFRDGVSTIKAVHRNTNNELELGSDTDTKDIMLVTEGDVYHKTDSGTHKVITTEDAGLLRLRSTSEIENLRDQNKDLFAASGFVNYGKQYDADSDAGTVINGGMWARWRSDPNRLWLGRTDVNASGTSETDLPVAHIAGVVSKMLFGDDSTHSAASIKFPEAPDGTVTYDSADGTIVEHVDSGTAFAHAETSATIEVVTERVDMAGFEKFLRNVTEADPYVYLGGCIQSQASTFGGVITTDDNVRPITYFAVYDGDTTSRGKGVDWFAATDEERIAIASLPARENGSLHYDAETGNVRQWCLRQRTIAGAGNGDWRDTVDVTGQTLRYMPTSSLNAQGIQDIYRGLEDIWGLETYFGKTNNYSNSAVEKYIGVFRAQGENSNLAAVNGECYFYVLGTVPRLNQGAYHPSFNPMGTSICNTTGSNNYWYATDLKHTATNDCFRPVYNLGVGDSTTVGYIVGYGDIASNGSGRNDGKYYDAIYPSGQGGFIDDRLSAYETNLGDVSKAKSKLKNGVLRGEQLLPWTNFDEVTVTTTDGSSVSVADGFKYTVGDTVHFEQNDGSYVTTTITGVFASYVTIALTVNRTSGNIIVHEHALNTSVEGNATNGFTVNDVIGDPANILQINALKNGWLGHWIPVIPDGTGNTPLTRKCLSSPADTTWTDNLGEIWGNLDATIDLTNNAHQLGNPTGRVRIYTYQAAPYVTTEDENRPVLFGEAGVGEVDWVNYYLPEWGGLLTECFLGKVTTNSASGSVSTIGVSHVLINPHGFMQANAVDKLIHDTAMLSYTPNNNSPAVKALIYPTSENQQVSLNAAYNELIYSGRAATVVNGADAQNVDPAGTLINLQATKVSGYYVKVVGSYGTASWDTYLNAGNLRIGDNGGLIGTSSEVVAKVAQFYNGDWGDDSTVRITDGQSTFNNLNGDACLYGTNRTKPIGWTKNKARIGTQTSGVDL